MQDLDTGAIARALSQVADRDGDHADLFLEALAEVRLEGEEGSLALSHHREAGMAVRLLRAGRSWTASSDVVSPDGFAQAIARVARVRPGAVAPPPRTLEIDLPTTEGGEVLERFADRVADAIRGRHAAFPLRWSLIAHRRETRTVGTMVAPAPQSETFFSCRVTTRFGRWGGLFDRLGSEAVESVADTLTSLFRTRRVEGPRRGRHALVLGPAAVAVLLHEAVAHVLETDTLALTGRPEAALGVRIAAAGLDVIDDPGRAPESVRRTVDDEGMPTTRRFLLRDGVVVAPLADLAATQRGPELMPGAGRRGSRHQAPAPRSYHLELLPPEDSVSDPVASCVEGLYVREFSRGRLDPLTGEIDLAFPYARRIERGNLGGLVGSGSVTGTVGQLLHRIVSIGRDPAVGGAGWCAKGGHRLAVWARAPTLLLDDVEVAGG